MKMQRLYGALCSGLMLISSPVGAAEQSSYVTPVAGPMNMATFAGTHLNPALRAIASCSWGTSAPANGPSGAPIAYQCWADTTTNPVVFKYYDSASWVTYGKLNISTHAWTPSYQGTDQGTASIATTGTSGHTLGFLDGANTWSAIQAFNDGMLSLKGSSSGAGTLKAPAAASSYVWTMPAATGTIMDTALAQTVTNKTINCANNVCTVRLASDVTGALPLANLATGTQDTALGYWGSTTASALAIGNCANALTYSTSTHTFGCNVTAGTGTVTSVGLVAGTANVSGTCTITTSGTCAVVSQTAPASWTPADGSGGSLSFSGVSARYTVIGNMVFANFSLSYPVNSDSSNNASVQGFPVTTPNVGYGNTACTVMTNNSTVGVQAVILQNTAKMTFYNAATGAVLKNINMSNFNVNAICIYPEA